MFTILISLYIGHPTKLAYIVISGIQSFSFQIFNFVTPAPIGEIKVFVVVVKQYHSSNEILTQKSTCFNSLA